MFAATCFSNIESSQNWLINNGCTNHMTNNKDLFKELINISTFKIQVEDDKFITVNEKGTITISTNRGTKLIFDMLYVPEIDKNLLSVVINSCRFYSIKCRSKCSYRSSESFVV